MNNKWVVLLILTGALALLYLWFTLFPGGIRPEALTYFQEEQIIQGKSYLFAHRLAYIISFALQIAVLGWLVFSGKAEALSAQLSRWTGGGTWVGRLLFFIILWLFLKLLSLPFSFFTGYWWEQQWGFLTQPLSSWWRDYGLSAVIDFVLSLGAVAFLFEAMDRWPRGWWFAGAAFTAFWVFVQTFLWPVLIAPLFNDFTPARDPEVLRMVEDLSAQAGVEVGDVLIMDASRRTTAANAYFTGLGKTKRIVLYDTLLRDYSPAEIKAVVAHEMAHWKHGHILKGIMTGILASFFLWFLLYFFLEGVCGLKGFYPPHTLAWLMLFLFLMTFLSSPVGSYLSRQMELEADRTAVMLTGDVDGAVALQVNLAKKNLADASPPAFIEWFSYSHPSAVVRIRSILTFE